ncbi:MAG: GAF domain-containing protein [Hyphomicrobiales bacterium]
MSDAESSEKERPTEPQARMRPWGHTLLIGGLLWGLLVILPDFSRLYLSLGKLGFSADNDGVVYSVDGPPATTVEVPGRSDPGLHVGDAIDLDRRPCWKVLGEECRNFMAVFAGMGGLTYVRRDTTVTLPFVPEGSASGAAVPLTFKAEKHFLSPMARFFLLLDELAGVFVIWRAFRLAWDLPNLMTVGFFLYAIWFNPGQYFAFYAFLQPYPAILLVQEVLQAIAQGAGYTGFLLFALRFPHGETEPRFRWIGRLAVPSGVLLAVLQLSSFANVFGAGTEILTRCAILGGYVVDLAVLAIVLWRRRLQSPLNYQRMRWVVWGCLIGLPAFLFADSNEATSLWALYVWNWSDWSPDESILEACYLMSGILAIFICEALRKPLVINVGYRLQGLAGFLLGVIAFAIVDHVYGEKVMEFLTELGLHPSLRFASSIASAVICGYLGDLGGHHLSHLLNRRFHQASRHIEEVGVALLTAESPESIERMVVEAPFREFHLTSAAVFREADGVFHRMQPSPGWRESHRSEFAPESSATLQQLIATKKSIRFADLPRELEAIPSGAAFPALAVPIATADRLYAVAVYGPHETGDDIDPLEEEVLVELARQAARGYEHSEMMALRKEVASLQQKLGAAAARL